MSVLIKGMEMPERCESCPFEDFGGCMFRVTRSECPLVEVPTPHGRLIDADALADVFRGHIALYDSCPFSQLSFTDKARCDELQSSLAEVINAPTIIEVEEGEGHE